MDKQAEFVLRTIEERDIRFVRLRVTCGSDIVPEASLVLEVDGKQQVINEHQALCHRCGHEFNHETGAKLPKRPTVAPEQAAAASAQISASWADPEVRAARLVRVAVEVDGVRFESPFKAFTALGIPLGSFHKFRVDLKAAGKLVEPKSGRTFVAIPK
jgi:hypothetical protein